MADAPTLAPCPFCKDQRAEIKTDGPRCNWGECTYCGARGPERGSGKEAAAKAWNRCAATPSPPVAAPPATPVAPTEWQALLVLIYKLFDASAKRCSTDKVDLQEWLQRAWHHDILPGLSQPQPQPAQPLTDAQVADLCGEANRGFCIESEHYFKAFRDAERAHGITDPAPGEKS